jgi:glycosyltransferase involved in cell wall biosynthesis
MSGAGELRVLFVNHTADVSGAEISLLELLTALPPEVRPAVCSPLGTLTRALPSDVPFYELRTAAAGARLDLRTTPREVASMALGIRQLRKVVDDFAPHVVHANSIRGGLVASALVRNRPPLVVHVRDVLPPHPTSRLVRALLLRRTDAIVANSDYTLEHFLDGRRPTGVLLRTVRNPIDVDRLERTARRLGLRDELGVPAEAHVLVHAAQVTSWKAQDDSVRILAKLRASGLDAHLLIAGETRFAGTGTSASNASFAAELRTLVSSLGVDDAVHFVGWRDDIASVYRAADVAILPSLHEPFGRVVVEAMAFEVPVVATSNGGPAEVLHDGIDGLLEAPRRPDEWARRIEGLLADPGARRSVVEAARTRVRAEFSPAAHAQAVLDVYRTLTAPTG